MLRLALRAARAPVDDYLNALSVSLGSGLIVPTFVMVVCVAGSWWVYVPVHELLHVAGCVVGGGEVTRLEVDPMYGAALLQKIFPFVVVGSHYAGQLTGFDTHGSDFTYLLTDFLPFTLTILIGVPLLRSAARARPGWRSATRLGVAVPIAFAPFISLPGDYYEMGSILVSRLFMDTGWAVGAERWRGDDVYRRVQELFFSGSDFHAVDVVGVAMSFCLGGLLAVATYAAGEACARLWEGWHPATETTRG